MSSKSLTKTQAGRVSQFVGVTGAPQRLAIECLQLSNWALEPAVDYYFSSGLAQQAAGPRVDQSALHDLFLSYKDAAADGILAEGIMRLCEDLGVEPEDVVVLVLSWHLGAQSMGEYTQDEFEGGLAKLGVDTLAKLRARLPRMRAEFEEPASYREIYKYAYAFSCEKGHKCLQLDTAIAMWELVVPPQRWRHIGDWCAYLRQHHKRAVSKDTWTQLLDFMCNVDEDFSSFDENGAWPYLIDEFVAWKQEGAAAADDGGGGRA